MKKKVREGLGFLTLSRVDYIMLSSPAWGNPEMEENNDKFVSVLTTLVCNPKEEEREEEDDEEECEEEAKEREEEEDEEEFIIVLIEDDDEI